VAIGKEIEQAFDLHSPALHKEGLEAARTEIDCTLHQCVSLVKALVPGQFVQQFQTGTLGT